jgi:hypothetical protein
MAALSEILVAISSTPYFVIFFDYSLIVLLLK